MGGRRHGRLVCGQCKRKFSASVKEAGERAFGKADAVGRITKWLSRDLAPLSSGSCGTRYGILQRGSERRREPERALTSTGFRESSERLEGATEENSLESGSFRASNSFPGWMAGTAPHRTFHKGGYFGNSARESAKPLAEPQLMKQPQLT